MSYRDYAKHQQTPQPTVLYPTIPIIRDDYPMDFTVSTLVDRGRSRGYDFEAEGTRFAEFLDTMVPTSFTDAVFSRLQELER